ncbi:MAG: sugar transferase [Candidatus Omnitrophica bacterium]|nr:sugar transferase [Candidatus Omnitrophota bacterium]
MIGADLCILSACFFLGFFLSNRTTSLYSLDVYIWILPFFLFVWAGLLHIFGMYASFRLKGMPQIVAIIGKTACSGLLLFAALGYLCKLTHISRIFIGMIFVLAALAIAVEKTILMQGFRWLRIKGFNFRNILVVGTGPRAQRFIREVLRHREIGLKVIGLVDREKEKIGQWVIGQQVIGTLEDIPNILHTRSVDTVVFIVPRSWLEDIEKPMHYCEMLGVTLSVAVDLFKLRFARRKEEKVLGFPTITFEPTSDSAWQLLLKRVLDIVLAGTALIALSPVLGLIALAIRLTSPGPVLFRQERCSLRGRKFTLYKFRTMVEGAEEKKGELLCYNEMEGPAFKMTRDPRVTRVGTFLRASSMDELPQLWNVLRGDMSLVGPRPPIPTEVEQYDAWQRRRLSMRPGITCLWQVNGRNHISNFDEWMKLDLDYIDRWSLWLDCKILFKTIPAVLASNGAK